MLSAAVQHCISLVCDSEQIGLEYIKYHLYKQVYIIINFFV